MLGIDAAPAAIATSASIEPRVQAAASIETRFVAAGADAAVQRRTAPVVLGAVTSRVAPAHLHDPVAALRSYLETELDAIDWSKRPLKGRYKLVASLVRMEAQTTKGGLAVSCTVSASIHDDKRGLLLTVDGKARAEDAPSAGLRAEQDALAAAVHSSLATLPDAIARAQ